MNSKERAQEIDKLNKDAMELGVQLLPSIGATIKLEKGNGETIEQDYPHRTMTKLFYKLTGNLLMQPHSITSTDISDDTFALPLLQANNQVTVVNKFPRLYEQPDSGNATYNRPHTYSNNTFVLINKARMSQSNDYFNGIIIGTGSDPESMDSIKLTTPLINGGHTITSTMIEANYELSTGIWTKQWTKSFFQSNNNTHTISEVGLFTYLTQNTFDSTFATATAAANYLGGLLDRIRLDTPVTISFGDRVTIDYQMSMQMPWSGI